jgi:protein SCO1
MFKVSHPPPIRKERFVTREPLTRAVSDARVCQYEHHPRARLTAFRFLVVLQVIFFTLSVPWLAWSHDQSAPAKAKGAERREVRIAIQDFILTDQSSRPFQFGSLRGKVSIVAFAYTTCPDVCPLTTAAMRQIQESLNGNERRSTHLITITTDPEIDTPETMAAYAKRHGADLTDWVFLTGQEAVLAKVWKNFGVAVHRKARGLVDHTPLTALVDSAGTMRIAYIGATPDANTIRHDLRRLLQSK